MNHDQKCSYFNCLLVLFRLFFLGILPVLELCQLSSCATKKDTEFIEVESRDVEESMGLDKDKFDKFQIEEVKKVRVELKKVAEKKVTLKKNTVSQRKTELSKIVKEKSAHTLKSKIQEEVEENPYPAAYVKYDQVSKDIWPTSKPSVRIGERFVFKIKYLGLTAGHLQMETKRPVKIGGQEVYHFSAKLRSARYYSYIYTLDDSIDTFVTVDKFLPIKYILSQRESAQSVDDLQLFDREQLKTYHWYKKIKHGKLKEEEITKPIPFYFQDSFSALLFLRTLPLKIGDSYEFPIVTRGKIWMLGVKVDEIEEIEIMDKDVLAIRINAKTRFPGVLERKGDILFWFSADEKKRLLKFEAQVKIGSVAGELVEYKDGKSL